MKIVLLSGASSVHTIRWANGLVVANNEVHVITQHAMIEPFAAAVHVHQLPFRGALGYFTYVPKVRKLVKALQPDIVSAHYASGYGTTARLVGFHPYVLSVWGSDIYEFPHKSALHRWLLRKNLYAADMVASTSRAMAQQTQNLASDLGELSITPFGVDFTAFDPDRFLTDKPRSDSSPLVIGTVKVMARKYGIDTLIRAFAKLCHDYGTLPDLALRLVGDGPQLGELKALAHQLGIEDKITFVGRVAHDDVPEELSKLDVYVALSRLESFGVAILEASAMGLPVVVSDAGGLPEVVEQGVTGMVVPREDPRAAADALIRLINDPVMRKRMGTTGRQHVLTNYSWDKSVQVMSNVYSDTLDRFKNKAIL